MTVRVKVDYDADGAERMLEGQRQRLDHLEPVLARQRQVLGAAFAANFAGGGSAVGGWDPLSPRYAAWKLVHAGPLPTLVLSGELFADVVRLDGPGGRVTDTDAVFKVASDIAIYHQRGTRYMPARPVVFAPVGFAERLGKEIADYVVGD